MRTLPNECLSGAHRETGPERRCILSGCTGPRESLVRLAVSPGGDVLPDVHARAPGRGAWIGVSRAVLEKALTKGKLKGALARAFRGAPLDIPADLPGRIESALTRALVERLGLEMRAGKLLAGSDRIGEQCRAGRVRWLAHASDAGDDGRRKLDQAWRVGRGEEGSGLEGVRLPLDRAALSVALGRDNAVHLALTDDAAAGRVSTLVERLLHFQGRERRADTASRERAEPAAAPHATDTTATPASAQARAN